METNRRAAAIICCHIQASVNAGLIQAKDFEPVQTGIWYCSMYYKSVTSLECCYKLEKALWHWMC